MPIYLFILFLVSCSTEKVKAPFSFEKSEIQVLTLDNMSDYEGSILEYVKDAPELQKKINQELQKSRELCKQGHDSNCDSIDKLKAQREDLHQGLIDISWVKACSTNSAILERKSLTGRVDPGLSQEFKVYQESYRRESGKKFDLKKCE